jgi:transposase
MDGGRLIFLDETAFKTNMTPSRGRAPRGRRLVDKVPHGHWKTTTCLAALSAAGLIVSDVFDGGMNGARFLAWVRERLVPVLRPGDTVFMDNLSAHKVAGVAEAVRAAGAEVRYLPPYSPDFNPIEKAFSQIKRHVRRLKIRDRDTLWATLRRIGVVVAPAHAANYLRSCGYALLEPAARAAG